MAGLAIDPFGFHSNPKTNTGLPTSEFGNPSTFTAAANKQASDYDTIMQSYRDFLSKNAANPPGTVSSTNVTPSLRTYSETPSVAGSLANLSNLATTGGYSDADIANIRARAISPIRSIYANAQQNVERQRALQGGYSPNFDAVQAEMARQEAQQIGDTTTNVEAGIAQNVAGNRIAISPASASAALSEQGQRMSVDEANQQTINAINEANAQRAADIGKFNIEAGLTNRNAALGAIQGQTSLYGTTPALTNTFGNQVVQAAQLGQGQQQLNQNNWRNFFGGARY